MLGIGLAKFKIMNMDVLSLFYLSFGITNDLSVLFYRSIWRQVMNRNFMTRGNGACDFDFITCKWEVKLDAVIVDSRVEIKNK